MDDDSCARPGGRQQTREGVAAIGTPGGSSLKTCGSSGVFGEQADEEMTLRPPCSVGEACDSQAGGDRFGPGDGSGQTGFGAVGETTGSGARQQRRECH